MGGEVNCKSCLSGFTINSQLPIIIKKNSIPFFIFLLFFYRQEESPFRNKWVSFQSIHSLFKCHFNGSQTVRHDDFMGLEGFV